MTDIKKINRFIKLSQCYLKIQDNGTYLLYDKYNHYNVKMYKTLDLTIILYDLKKHLDLKIQSNLVDNTIKELNYFFDEKFNIFFKIDNNKFLFTMEDGSKKIISFHELESFNIYYLKSTLMDKLGLSLSLRI